MLLRDPVHGLIEFEGEYEKVLRALLDTGEVQRLRRISQLGMTNFAFPGAEHSRFTHAIGTAAVMMKLHHHIQSIQQEVPKEFQLTPESARDSFAAAFLHDLGHGPFSHLFEEVIVHAKRHESWTFEIIQNTDTEIHKALEKLSQGMSDRVISFLDGSHPLGYLTRAVSGTLDVDRCDYLLRDSLLTGVHYGLFDLDWLIRNLIFIETTSHQWALGIDGKKSLPAIESFFLGRHFMYQQVYHHKTTRASEALFRGLLARVAFVLRQKEKTKVPPALRSAIWEEKIDLQDYLAMDDHEVHACFSEWEKSKDPTLSEFAMRVRKRRLPKTIDLTVTQFENYEEIFEQAIGIASKTLPFANLKIWIDCPRDTPFEEDENSPEKTVWVMQENEPTSSAPIPLSSASFLLGQIKNKRNIHPRIIFPAELREKIVQLLGNY